MIALSNPSTVQLRPIDEVAHDAGLLPEEVELYGRKKAKVSLDTLDRLADRPDGKVILVTAMTASKAGEGKTVTSIGLAEAFAHLGISHMLALREPSLGPTLGIKGGGTGGGQAQVQPMEEINLHFTGDFHAISSAHNLLAACIDNNVYFGNRLGIERVTWRRVMDLCDRQLREVQAGLGGKSNGHPHTTGFDITAASEIMAILALSTGIQDLKERLDRIVVGYHANGSPVYAREVGCTGAMAALLRDAIRPNLAQTSEGTPAFIHAGPFANIAHGCNSVLATRLAMKLADYVVTEAGFAADLGAEKFFHIKCRQSGIRPSMAVLVVSCRALRLHGLGSDQADYLTPNPEALLRGLANARVHVENLQRFGLPVVVALNHFTGDADVEVTMVRDFAASLDAGFAVSEVAQRGGEGGVELAHEVMRVLREHPAKFRFLYSEHDTIREKIDTIAREIYRADGVDYSPEAVVHLEQLELEGLSRLPICMAKTQLSLSDNPKLLGAPHGWRLNVRDMYVSNGAGFIVVLAGKMMLMPGMPEHAAFERIQLDDEGTILGVR